MQMSMTMTMILVCHISVTCARSAGCWATTVKEVEKENVSTCCNTIIVVVDVKMEEYNIEYMAQFSVYKIVYHIAGL